MSACKFMIVFLIISGAIFQASCSNDGANIVATNPAADSINAVPLDVMVTDRLPDGRPSAGYGFLGLYEVHVDSSSLGGSIASVRNTALEDVLEEVDLTNFLTMAPCSNCAKLKSVSMDSDGNLVLSIGVKHPFAAGDPFKPITGRNRADLHVFNIEGIVVTDGLGVDDFTSLGVSCADSGLVNADGYTAYLDNSLDRIFPTEANIHPYILHFDDFSDGNYNPANPMGFQSATDPPPSGHLVMPMGCDYDYKDYVFDTSEVGSFDFIYAIGCTYAVTAATKTERFTPEYRCPQHNKKAATTVSVNIVSNNLLEGEIASTADLEINVVDVNHGIPVGTALNEMRADSSVSAISLEIPGIMSSVVNVPLTPSSGDGLAPSTVLVYPVTITNSLGAGLGFYRGLVKVKDSCPTGLNGAPTLNGKDGIERVDPLLTPLTGLFDIPEFATYMTFEIEVQIYPNIPPVADLQPDDFEINLNASVNYDATGSYDPDGSIVLYEFDFVWDGIEANFSPDASNATGIVISAPYTTAGDFTAGVRVTDDRDAVDYASVTGYVCGETIIQWRTNLPDITTARSYAASIILNDQLWMIGGDATTTMEVFDLPSETWVTTPRAPIPGGRTYAAAAYHNGKIYVIGGMIAGERTNTTVVYTIASNTWDTTTVPPFLGTPRNVGTAATYQDEIYFAFGLTIIPPSQAVLPPDLDIYTPATNTWRAGAPASRGRASPFFIPIGDRIYAGFTNSPIAPEPHYIEYYEPATDTWTHLGDIPATRFRRNPGTVAVGTKIYVVGGSQNQNTSYNWVDVYDTADESWTQLMNLPEDRGCLPGCAFYDCKLYVASGRGTGSPG